MAMDEGRAAGIYKALGRLMAAGKGRESEVSSPSTDLGRPVHEVSMPQG